MMKLKISTEFNDTREQLQKHGVDVSILKREIQELVEHKERLGGNITGIEERLNITERQLRGKKAQLEDLETETKDAFTETQKLLKLYKDGLFHLKSTTQDLEDKVETRLNATKTDFGAKLKEVQDNSEAFTAKLKEQKAEVVKFMEETGSKFSHVDEQLRIQNTSVDQQISDIDSLKNKNTGITNRLGSVEKRVGEQSKLKPEVDQLKARVNAKVAFSATIIESKDVFTGPRTAGTSKILIFNKVFTNIGNAYNCKTGLFTAPQKGVYHFSFMTFGYSTYYTSGAILVKNGKYQVSTWEFKGPDSSDTTSNTVILELNHRDTVNIILWQGGKINTSVFSGFLVFPTK
ncbi:uncharacterized protein LOC134005495 [Scomber scombrus]|uniref:uncharacterized protein LOC134005495 n=1 Tax=Scomber scombrus TaxID=13677 RepID=UPI002DD7F05C|nr:uncharacterized protein LOC134005495 [Scomber scombrus]